jgi:hypothetical protein
VESFPTPYKYRVSVVRVDAMGSSNPSHSERQYLIPAWTAEDAFVQTEILLGLRGQQCPAYRIIYLAPYEPMPEEQIFGTRIYRWQKEDPDQPGVGFGA